MKTIKIILFVSILFLASNCRSQTNKAELEVFSKNLGAYNLSNCDSSYFFLIEVQLINKSKTTFKFLAYSCLTCYNFLVDNDNVSIYGNFCSANSVSPIAIEPNQKLTIPLILQVKKMYYLEITRIKIGFVYLSPSNFKGDNFRETIAELKMNRKNIIWSNAVLFQLPVDKQYKISQLN